MQEIWKDIEGYEGCYQVSNKGNARSLNRTIIDKNGQKMRFKGKVVKQYRNRDGYLLIHLTKNCKKKSYTIHRTVAKTFIKNEFNKKYINHKDGNKENNTVENLEWVTHSENIQHAYDIGLKKKRKGFENPKFKMNILQVKEIKRLYKTGKYSFRSIAKMYNTDHGLIARVVRMKI